MRFIVNYIRSLFCRHDFELIAKVKEHDVLLGDSGRLVYRCRKCGYVQRVKL